MIETVLLCFALCSSVLLTGLLRGYAAKFSLYDIPNPRSSHVKATPRGGGLAIVLSFLTVLFYRYHSDGFPSEDFLALFYGGLLVAGVGFWDDHRSLSARWRIVAHFTAAALVVFLFHGFPVLQISNVLVELGWWGYLIGMVFLVWLLNLFNFMDGIDGLAALEAITVAAGAAFIMYVNGNSQDSFLLFVLVAASIGFLIWNWPPAKIFMGDAGSGFLGFTLGVFAVSTAMHNHLPIWVWIILLGVFLTDSTFTLMRRIFRGERFYKAHRSHAYQYAARRFRSHKKVSLAVLCINVLWLLPLAWIASSSPRYGFYITVVALLPLIILAITFEAGKQEGPPAVNLKK